MVALLAGGALLVTRVGGLGRCRQGVVPRGEVAHLGRLQRAADGGLGRERERHEIGSDRRDLLVAAVLAGALPLLLLHLRVVPGCARGGRGGRENPAGRGLELEGGARSSWSRSRSPDSRCSAPSWCRCRSPGRHAEDAGSARTSPCHRAPGPPPSCSRSAPGPVPATVRRASRLLGLRGSEAPQRCLWPTCSCSRCRRRRWTARGRCPRWRSDASRSCLPQTLRRPDRSASC